MGARGAGSRRTHNRSVECDTTSNNRTIIIINNNTIVISGTDTP